jgi:histidine ammonia-lyase
MSKSFQYGIDNLTVAKAASLAQGTLMGILSPAAVKRIKQSQRHVREIVENQTTVYGVNTGFGILSNKKISDTDTITLQHKILQSHSVGVGNPIAPDLARLMLITKIHALTHGYSGVQLSTLERILLHIEKDIIPVVPEKGSVGASGDLAPLAHLFLPLIGLGEVYYQGGRFPSKEVLNQLELKPIELGPKEGLALINGTQFILSFAVKAVQRMHHCLQAADIIGAMSLEALTGTKAPFDERLHRLRPFAGSSMVAQRLRLLLRGSEIMQPQRLAASKTID